MSTFTERYVAGFMNELVIKNPSEPEFHQAVKEVLESVAPVLESSPHFLDQKIMERMTEPERVIIFRVTPAHLLLTPGTAFNPTL